MRTMTILALIAAATAPGCRRSADAQETQPMPTSSGRNQAHAPQEPNATMPPLSRQEERIIVHKGTEPPFTGQYWNSFQPGVYVCRRCGAELYRSDSKFRSDCGWPSFDQEVPGAVKRQTDADGRRTEILCARCGAHLGHVFLGEGLTPRNTRHCVNSLSLVLRPAATRPASQPASRPASKPATQPATRPATQEALFAGGCFWGVEHLFGKVPGVVSATSGYTGGSVKDPTYQQVAAGTTGHAEAVRVVFDPAKTSYEQLAKYFFEIHDPTTRDRQGPDTGTQYRSAVFYKDDAQKAAAEALIRQLKALGYAVVTEVTPASEFYPAEEYHQDYLTKHPGRPDCHVRVPRFEKKAQGPR